MFVRQKRVVDLDFAHDVALLAGSWLVIVAVVMKMEEITQSFEGNISTRKSVLLYIGRNGLNIRIEEISLRGPMMKQIE